MTSMLSEVHEAFHVAGISDDQAKQAAEPLSAKNLARKQKTDNCLFR